MSFSEFYWVSLSFSSVFWVFRSFFSSFSYFFSSFLPVFLTLLPVFLSFSSLFLSFFCVSFEDPLYPPSSSLWYRNIPHFCYSVIRLKAIGVGVAGVVWGGRKNDGTAAMRDKKPGRAAIGIWLLPQRALSPKRSVVDRSLIRLNFAKRKMELSTGFRRSASRVKGTFLETNK